MFEILMWHTHLLSYILGCRISLLNDSLTEHHLRPRLWLLAFVKPAGFSRDYSSLDQVPQRKIFDVRYLQTRCPSNNVKLWRMDCGFNLPKIFDIAYGPMVNVPEMISYTTAMVLSLLLQ